jgi:hypothetical protein
MRVVRWTTRVLTAALDITGSPTRGVVASVLPAADLIDGQARRT